MRSLLSAPDDSGARWSYDRTISVRADIPGAYTIRDFITRTTHGRQSLDQARRVVRDTLDARPQLDWVRSWKREGVSSATHSWWWRQSADGAVDVRIVRLPEGWWGIEIDVDRNIEGGVRSYGWRVDGCHPVGVVQAQALAWASYRASDEGRS